MTNRNKTKLPFPEIKQKTNESEMYGTLGKTLSDYFGSPQAGKASFWRTPLAKPLGALQRLANKGSELKRPDVQIGDNLPANLAEGVANTALTVPRNLAVGITRTGKDLGDAIAGRDKFTGMEAATGLAPFAEAAMLAYGMPLVGSNLIRNTGKTLGSSLARGAGLGSVEGGGLSFFRELENQRDRERPDWDKLTDKTIEGSLAGAVFGALLSGTAHGTKWAKNRLTKSTKKAAPELSTKEAKRWVDRMERDLRGRFTGLKPKYKKPKMREIPVHRGKKTSTIEIPDKYADQDIVWISDLGKKIRKGIEEDLFD